MGRKGKGRWEVLLWKGLHGRGRREGRRKGRRKRGRKGKVVKAQMTNTKLAIQMNPVWANAPINLAP